MLLRAILGHLRIFKNTVEVGGADLKGGQMLGRQSSTDMGRGQDLYDVYSDKRRCSYMYRGKENCPGPRVECPNEPCVAAWEAGVWG